MKATTETLDRTVVKRPLNKQNLCLDKGYDYPEIEREYLPKEDTCHIFVTEVWGERIDKDRVCKEEMGCYRKNQFVAQQIQKVISKVQKEIRKISCTSLFSLPYYCLQENSFGIGSK